MHNNTAPETCGNRFTVFTSAVVQDTKQNSSDVFSNERDEFELDL